MEYHCHALLASRVWYWAYNFFRLMTLCFLFEFLCIDLHHLIVCTFHMLSSSIYWGSLVLLSHMKWNDSYLQLICLCCFPSFLSCMESFVPTSFKKVRIADMYNSGDYCFLHSLAKIKFHPFYSNDNTCMQLLNYPACWLYLGYDKCCVCV